MKRILFTLFLFSCFPISWSYAQCDGIEIEIYLENTPVVRYDETFPFKFCRQQLPLILEGNKDNGIFNGMGTTQDSVFNPVSGTGDFNIRYDVPGCPSYFFTITLEEVTVEPVLDPYPDYVFGSFVCVNADPFTITGNLDDNSTVVISEDIFSNEFNPALLGPGLHQIDYFYTDPISQCIITTTDRLRVVEIPDLGIANIKPSYCLSEAPVRFVPVEDSDNSQITGPGFSLNSGLFTPLDAGVGEHKFTHHYEDLSKVCEESRVFTITVVDDPQVAISSLSGNCYLNTDTIVYSGEALPDSVELTWDVNEELGSFFQQGNQLIVNWNNPGTHEVELALTNTTCETTYTPTIVKEGIEVYIDTQDQVVKANTSVSLPVVGQSTDPTAVLSYNWSPSTGLSCIDCPDPSALIEETTTYIVTVSDENGCSATDEVTLTLASGEVFVPNAFTPNGDGRNDELLVMGSGMDTGVLTVFDRWGAQMFQSEDLSQGWDGTFEGKTVNSGTFFYILEVNFLDGTQQKFKGNVTVIR